ncbi:DUF6894 family protein [Sphingomonas sp.]|jgi:hypothetical protein|uniref:DUF6894 family protein n=1 Tax=Sphingomonas sp. TaxID=28214 RepID=UPI002EDA59FE
MTQYFLHLRDHVDEVLDPEGLDFENVDVLKRAVVEAARDVMCADLRNGIIDFRYRIDAENAAGQIVYTLPFSAAVSIIAEDSRAT